MAFNSDQHWIRQYPFNLQRLFKGPFLSHECHEFTQELESLRLINMPDVLTQNNRFPLPVIRYPLTGIQPPPDKR